MRKVIIRLVGALAITLVVALALAWTPDTDRAAMRAKYGGPPSQFVKLGDGLTVHLRDEGPRDAPVIVLLHGSNADLHTWDAWTRRLTPRYRVVRFDQIGHGLTGPNPTRDYSSAAFVSTVDMVTRQLGITRFVLAGNSMGGLVASNYALRYPAKVAALVLLDPSGAPRPAGEQPPLAFRIAQNPLIRPLLLHITPRWLVASGIRGAVAGGHAVSDATIDRYWELLRYPGNRQATIDRQLNYGAARQLDLAGLVPPTLIMWGEEDRVLPVANLRWFAERLPRAALIRYPGIGHIPMEEAPDRSAADLTRWLATLPERPA